MNQKFHYSLKKKENVQYSSIMGVIDEDNNLQELGERIGAGTVILNLGNIERINSCGVRDWVNWLAVIDKKGTSVIVVEASPAIVAQINLVNNFAGNSVIKSFFAPYYCSSCDKEKVLLVEAKSMENVNAPKAPISRCDECDGVMEFDDMEESYFAFLKNAKLGPLPNELPEGWEDLIHIESTGTSDKRVRTRERTFRGRNSLPSANMSSLPGSLPSSLPSLPPTSLPSLPSMRDKSSANFSSFPSFPSGEHPAITKDSSSSDAAKSGNQKLLLGAVVLLTVATVGVMIYVAISLL